MIIYTLAVILSTLMLFTGFIFYVISMFSGKVERPLVFLIGCLFWPFSLLIVYSYVLIQNRFFS
jgi:hypothetical protein